MIAQATKHHRPALVEVIVSPIGSLHPSDVSLVQAKGFSPFMLSAVLTGRGGELIDLAKTNFLR
jgi:pyruvate dehydrogenase (quinone)